jgi:single-strand DNA-binding protein
MNVITLAGRAGRDPELKYFESGSMVANLSLAVNAAKKGEDADWFELKIWGKSAQVAADYVRKGSQIAVTGRMSTERWVDKNTGEKRQKYVVNVDRLSLLGSKGDNDSQANSRRHQQAAAVPMTSIRRSDHEHFTGDIEGHAGRDHQRGCG